jgi:hypothetical protein
MGPTVIGRLLLVLMLLAQAGLLAYNVFACSCTYDEPAHIGTGLLNVRSGDFSAYAVNPPLSRVVAALPLSCLSAKSDEPYSAGRLLLPQWEHAIGRRFLEENADGWMRYVRIARVPCVLFALAGSALCYCWATRCYGVCAGSIAAGLWITFPYVLGHGCLVTGDVPAAAMGLAAVYCFWRWLRKPQWPAAIAAGLVLGLAELCKFTLLIFYPLLPLLWLVYRLPERRMMDRPDWLRQVGMLSAALLVSICVINCGYVFEDTFTPLGEFRFRTMMFTGYDSLDGIPAEGGNRFTGTWIGKLPVPLPAHFVQGIDTLRRYFEAGIGSYLHGEWADHGWWYYYLYALAIKLPLGTMCLVALAMAATILGWKKRTVPFSSNDNRGNASHGCPPSWRDEMIILAPFVMVLAFLSSETGFSVHSRYVIPALPFLFVWTSKVGRVFAMRPFTGRRLAVAATIVLSLVWSACSSLSIYPHSLSYFNELAAVLSTPADRSYPTPVREGDENDGILSSIKNVLSAGPRNGPRHLLDSNIDWGQDLLYLKEWYDGPGTHLDGLAYWGSCPPTLAGLPQTPHPPTHPQAGWYALSVNYIYSREGQYRYFLHFRPIAMAGYSIYIYHITPNEASQVRRQLGLPDLPGHREADHAHAR